jgi:hydrogenase expression/formation protein HypD
MEEVFSEQDSTWRGLGLIPGSGLAIRDFFSEYDASRKYSITPPPANENYACICGAVMRGVRMPTDCALFGKTCTPQNPVGACMVSAEGSCGIYYRYGKT